MKSLRFYLKAVAVMVLIASCLMTACSPVAIPGTQQNSGGSSNSTSSTTAKMPAPSTSPGQAGTDNISLLLRAEDYDEAIQKARADMESDPSNQSFRQKLADAYIARAWFYKIKRLTTYTLADLSKAVEAAPDYYRSHYEMGLFHNNQWMFGIGLLDFNKALALKPDFAPAYAERSFSNYKNQKYEPALVDVNRAIELDPTVARFYCVRSLIYAATGNIDLAQQDAEKAVSIAPEDAFSYYNRSLIHTAAGKTELAIADLETTLKLSKDDLLTARANEALQILRK